MNRAIFAQSYNSRLALRRNYREETRRRRNDETMTKLSRVVSWAVDNNYPTMREPFLTRIVSSVFARAFDIYASSISGTRWRTTAAEYRGFSRA